VGKLTPGQRTPVFLMGTSWDRHSWYLRLPCAPGAPWAGIVRVECAADLPRAEVIRLADLSQACLGRFASAPYKDSRAPRHSRRPSVSVVWLLCQAWIAQPCIS
jgi:hypothetical protein